MRPSILIFMALLSVSMGFPSPPSFSDTTLDPGDDLSQLLAFGDSTTSDPTKSDSDSGSDPGSGTHSNTNLNFFTDSNTDVTSHVAGVSHAPDSFKTTSGSDISANVLADSTPILTAQNAVGPCPQKEDWASLQETAQLQDETARIQEETTRRQKEVNQREKGYRIVLENWHDTLDAWQATLERCETTLSSGGRCSFQKHPKPSFQGSQ